mgnify:CR=1 FL=1
MFYFSNVKNEVFMYIVVARTEYCGLLVSMLGLGHRDFTESVKGLAGKV